MQKAIKLIKIIFLAVLVIFLLNIINIARIVYPFKYSESIKKYSAEYELDPHLICGIIKAESNFTVWAVSNKKARGLMQITDPTAEWIAEKLGNSSLSADIIDPDTNIKMGCYYIRYLLDMYDDNEKCALAAYNAGFNVVDRWLDNPIYSTDSKNLTKIPYRETELYVTKVLNNKQIYDILYKSE